MANMATRPSLFWLLSEPGRALTELAISMPYKNTFKSDKLGDGHPVLVLPGFMSSGKSTAFIRGFIADLGYDVYEWGMGRNLGKVEYIELIAESIDEIFKKTGKQVTIIGWSLGGVFARQVAKQKSDLVRQVITLGSPFAGITEPNNVSWIYTLVSGGERVKNTNNALLENLPVPAGVPTTAIYSKEDGIVPWSACMELTEDEIHQNIQVRGSHIGLGVNPCVLTIVADRLKHDKVNWKPFKPEGYINKLIFPA